VNSPVGVVWPKFLESGDGSGDDTMLSASVQADAMFFSGEEEDVEDEDELDEDEEEDMLDEYEELLEDDELEDLEGAVFLPDYLQLGREDDEGDEEDDEGEFMSDSSPPSVSDKVPEAPAIHVSPVTPQSPHGRKKKKKLKKPKKSSRRDRHYEFNANSNVVGVVFLEIHKVEDLPPERNVTRTGFDMDPFVVVSFGKKTFRTPWKRHTLNPVFNEKLLFPVHKNEQMFSINFTVMDKDRFSLNDFVAETHLNIGELLETAPAPDIETGLYKQESLVSAPLIPENGNSKRHHRLHLKKTSSQKSKSSGASTPARESGYSSAVDMSDMNNSSDTLSDEPTSPVISNSELKEFQLDLRLKHESKWESKYNPRITIRGRFLPYAALRQHFWRGLIRLYDIDDTNAISYVELCALLDSLGSTLSDETKKGFFERFNRSLEDELSVDEVVICLEEQVLRDSLQEKHYKRQHAAAASGGLPVSKSDTESLGETDESMSIYSQSVGAESDTQLQLGKSYGSSIFDGVDESERGVEHVIQINTCPVCNQPRLKKRSEIDIVTHLAICASQNWAKVDALVMDRYVTSSHARKRWYSKIMSKVSYGNYRLGANSANILVQDRITGYVMEEKMSAYVRLGIRLLYRGIKSSRRMEAKRIRSLLRSLSIKQGRKYDSPSSVQSIMHFIKFHNIDMEDVLEPVENFKNFNEFFYRKLKPGARRCDAPDQPKVAVSPADCRTTVFGSISRATEIWIKGREFSIARLFGDAYPDMVDKFTGGSLAIFRLAPQDYHRFHIPVDGVLGKPKTIEGEYYTVNPMAIRSSLDVYGENVRVLVPIESDVFGTVMVVCVGAMMVGSTVITAKEGQRVERLDELGYFQFGGSTLVVLFQPNSIEFDGDLTDNSEGALETLVRVGMSIGHTPDIDEFDRREWKLQGKESVEAKEWAARRINGGVLTDEDDVSTKS
jgi:phosphatidylserine decarboxylase